ncbi:hypothetical protein IFR05_016993, partial [Cadophora sp. M221]
MDTLEGLSKPTQEIHYVKADASDRIAPKIFIITMFSQEATNWLSDESAIKFDRTIRVPGLSHGHEDVRYNAEMGYQVVNAALSISALTLSPLFDLTKTYFILSGIAGVNPKVATIGSVALAKFAVQVDIQLEFDRREIPESWTTGYLPIGAPSHGSFPSHFTGSEVFELNDKLRKLAISFARGADLVDSGDAIANRALYAGSANGVFEAAASQKPSIIEGDVTASNMFYHGRHLAEGFEDLVKLYTSSQAQYTMTAMEDTGILSALLRAAVQERVDFTRIILMRAGSNFDRSYCLDDNNIISLPFVIDHGGFRPACRNLYLSGMKVVDGILGSWDIFEKGVEADNYVGDVFGSLGGIPNIGRV